MAEIRLSKLVQYPWEDLFDLIMDVERYSVFVPHCRDVKIVSRNADKPHRTKLVARMSVSFANVDVDYTSAVVADRLAKTVEIRAIDGPFHHLTALWHLTEIGSDQTEIGLDVDYKFKNRLFAMIASQFVSRLYREFIDAFEKRAATFGTRRPIR